MKDSTSVRKDELGSDHIEDAERGPIHQQRIIVTKEDNKTILRKIDLAILPILVWVYFLQVLDKSVLGYSAVFGLQQDTGLVGSQYSLVGSMAPIAQLVWLPFSSFLIVKVPGRILMASLVLGWGLALATMAACHNFGGLATTRFFLGLFEAACLPLFSIITSLWYRRAEQPLRVAIWYSMNGMGTIIGSAISYGLAQIPSPALKPWQIIFLFVGLVTIVTAPVVYLRLDNDIDTARFLTERQRAQAMERLRANQTGLGSAQFKWDHIIEGLMDPKTYVWLSMALLLNTGASVANIFGPLILNGLGFNQNITLLLNMPFGAVQVLIIIVTSYIVQRSRMKSVLVAILILPVIAGLATLYRVPRTHSNQGVLLMGYYFLAFLYGANPLIMSWILGNTAGQTKKSMVMCVFNIGVSAGNLVGPQLFTSKDAPAYIQGLRAVLGIFVALLVLVFVQLAYLVFLNKMQMRKRKANGKQEIIQDRSMMVRYTENDENMESERVLVDPETADITDRKNDEFIYIY
ncbi:hypothetical protein B7463_g2377, partial [Scytalidium lignicola]